MEYINILNKNELQIVKNIFDNEIKIPNKYFIENIIDFSLFDNTEVSNLIIKFLNDLSRHIDEEIEFHNKFEKYVINLYLIKPIDDKRYIKFSIICENDEIDIYVIFNNIKKKIDINIFNCMIAYLVEKGTVYDYNIETILQK